RTCVGRIASPARNPLGYGFGKFKIVCFCSAYAHTQEYPDKRALCFPRNFSKTVTSGMEFTCVAKRPSFDHLEPCLKDQLD
ncbi:hypothetical protein PFISCL1PPCAC_22624, partial [Pristionchus fissidentatus]